MHSLTVLNSKILPGEQYKHLKYRGTNSNRKVLVAIYQCLFLV